MSNEYDLSTMHCYPRYCEPGYTCPRHATPEPEQQQYDCQAEFGPHEHESEESAEECQRIIHDMSPDYDDGLADALNREAEESMLGRPLFPNEY